MVKSSQIRALSQYRQKGTLSKYHRYIRPISASIVGFSLASGFVADTFAQDAIEWKQTFQYDDSQSAPASISLDILGIKIGDTYETAKAKLDSMAAELSGDGATVEPRERKAFFKLPVGSGQFVETTFVSDIKLDINRYPNQPNGESLEVHFSAPSSGAQAYNIVRTLNYGDNTKQPKISELQARLAEKFGTKPFSSIDRSRRETRFYIVFNDGNPVQGKHIDQPMLGEHCVGLWSDMAGGYTQHNSNSVQSLNRNGDCDVVLTVILDHGISEDHFTRASFYLSDFERAKQSIGADYDFFQNYIDTLQSTGGESPKL